MPTIAIIDGIRIVIFFNDHAPPHFHAFLGEHRFRVEIETARSMDGRGSTGPERKLAEWADRNRDALLAAWADAQAGRPPRRIG